MSEVLNYDNLVAGSYPMITDAVVLGASQTVARGDLLRLAMTPEADTGDGAVTGGVADTGTGTVTEGVADTGTGAVTGGVADTGDGSIEATPGANWLKAAAAADIFSVYAIAAEAKTTGAEETAAILVYRTGEFNENKVGFGGESTADQNRDVLAGKGIFLKKSQKA